MRVPVDRGDEGRPEAVDRERSGNEQRLARADVGVQFGVVDVIGEGDASARDSADRSAHAPSAVVDHPVTGVQHAAGPPHPLPAFEGDLGSVRFAVEGTIEFEERVPAEDDSVESASVVVAADDGLGLRPGEHLYRLPRGERSGGRGHGILVDPGRDRDRVDARRAESCEPRGGGGGEVEPHGTPKLVRMGEMQGRTIDLDVTKIAHGGISVARHEGRVVFVGDAIPGERVRALVSDDRKKSFLRADTVEVLEASEHRRPHVWTAASVERAPAERAGGAEFGHIDLAHQRALKAEVLREALERMAGLDREVVVEEVAGANADGTGWRTRVSLHVDSAGRLGPFAARSHRVIPVDDLPLAVAELTAGAPLGEEFRGYDRVDVLAPSSGGVRLIIGDQKPSEIVEIVGEREFRLADTGFWQVHRGAPLALTRAVQEAIDPDRFDPAAANLDLYGGVGLLAAAVADHFGAATRITSVESDERATDYASANLSEWVGARAETGRVERWLAKLAADAGAQERARLARATVVLDPPRSGAGAEVIDVLAALGPEQLVYVACDPVAFARDTALLAGHGYRLDRLRALDLFPHTHHVEAVGTFVRQ